MSRFLNTTRTAIKYKDLVAYGIAHRAEIVTHAIGLIELMADVFMDPSCQAQFKNAVSILTEIKDMPATRLIKLFNKKGDGLESLLGGKPEPVDFEFFARIVPNFVSWVRVQIKNLGMSGPAMLSALTITSNLTQKHISVIIGHYDAFVALLKGHKLDSPLLSEAMTAAKRMKQNVEERLVHLRRRVDKTTSDAYGPQALISDEHLDDGPVSIPTPTPNDMKQLISRLNAGDYSLDLGMDADDDADEEVLHATATSMGPSSSSSSSSSIDAPSTREEVADVSTPEPKRKQPYSGKIYSKKSPRNTRRRG